LKVVFISISLVESRLYLLKVISSIAFVVLCWNALWAWM